MKHTKGEWICNDIDAVTGEFLIQNEAGKLIGEVYNTEDIPLIKSAPKLLKALKEVEQCLDNVFQKESELPISIIKAYDIINKTIKSTGQ